MGAGAAALTDRGHTARSFAEEYRALRASEGWADQNGHEDPEGGLRRLWRGRTRAVDEAMRILLERLGGQALILDVGAGGGWAARMMRGARVVAIDLAADMADSPLAIRGDMQKLPLSDGVADGALYAASLHYAPLHAALGEAARVLRPDGLLVAVDSPIYPGPAETARSVVRARAYYAGAGHPALAASYFPIDAVELRRAITEAGLRLERLEVRPRWLQRLRAGPASLVVASRLR